MGLSSPQRRGGYSGTLSRSATQLPGQERAADKYTAGVSSAYKIQRDSTHGAFPAVRRLRRQAVRRRPIVIVPLGDVMAAAGAMARLRQAPRVSFGSVGTAMPRPAGS